MHQKIKNAVQPEEWFSALPRPQYKTLKKIDVSDKWYEVYLLDDGTYALYEPGHFQEVISFLIIGSEKAMLLDTGMGFSNIKAVCEELTDKPIFVVNSHSHFDHIGCNYMFEDGWFFNSPPAIQRSKTGLAKGRIAMELAGNSTYLPYPSGFDPNEYSIPSYEHFKTFDDGHIFELGGRTLKAIHTPGHSPDSIMLVDEANKILFTGDTFYPAVLYAHLDSEEGLTSIVDIYSDTMRKLSNAYSDYTLYCSHNEPVRPGKVLTACADAFDKILKGDLEYIIDDEGLKRYDFDGFSIVTQ